MNNTSVEPVRSLPRGSAHPVTELAIKYMKSIEPARLITAADTLDASITSGSTNPNMGVVSETLRRVAAREAVSDRYLNSAAFFVLYNVVLANSAADGVDDANPAA